ncbi:AAA family ATPase [Nonomuraea sp. NPDC051941]|uniref:bifunctional aminoglycoside phosphotransferase/ATP-binding protein n=1 Tax=Nonomuraea sp. NPDC051941 TaxID=3364373 RepID=UPI0037C5EB92
MPDGYDVLLRDGGIAHVRPAPPADREGLHELVVFLVGDHAYKLKKPDNFATLHARQEACRREVELNRRLAPDVYEGVASVLGPDGTVCEYLVVMRRMPEERRLATLVRAGKPVEEHVRAVARQLAELHTKARRGSQIDQECGIRSRWTAAVERVRGIAGATIEPAMLDEIERLVLRFLDGRSSLFEARTAEGRIVEGHGDLVAEDIFCLDDGPRILSCLDYDERLRFLDGLDDSAFLAMDLEWLGAPRLADLFLRWYVEFSGDQAPTALWHHYVAYRAFVRAENACVRHSQGDVDAAWEARRLAELALRHLHAATVTLVLVGGPVASGKTTLARALADRLGFTLLRSSDVPPESEVYAELVSRAERLLGQGESVVLDASWADEQYRAMATQAADRTSSNRVSLLCTVMPQLAATRLATRETPSSAPAMSPWPDAIEIDTGIPLEQALMRALSAVHPPELNMRWRFQRPQMEPD